MLKLEPLPPEEAIKFFEQKGLVLSERWDEIWQEMHAKAFTVAGVMRLDVLADIYEQIKKAIKKGTTLAQFKKDFQDIMKRRGWYDPKFKRPWRLETIFRTNVQTAYQAGRYKQQKEMADIRPYWMYDAVNDSRTRPSHAAMDGKVFRADDPIWETWYPPNGFNCRCRVVSLSKRQVQSRGLQISEGKGVKVKPDKGWGYNPGVSAFGPFQPVNKSDLLEKLKTYRDYPHLPFVLSPNAKAPEKLPKLKDYQGSYKEYKQLVKSTLGIEEKEAFIFDVLGQPVKISDELIEHILKKKDGREQFIPYVVPTLKKPNEIWLQLWQKKTGKYIWRKLYLKGFFEEKKRFTWVTAEVGRDGWVFWNVISSSDLKRINNYRQGLLLNPAGASM